MNVFISIPWYSPAFKAGGPIQSIANMVNQLSSDTLKFKIFTSNKDLDGTLLQDVAYDEWVPYNANTKVWYNSTNKVLAVLQREIKTEKPDYLLIIGIYDWQYNFKPLLFCKVVKKIISVRGMLHAGALSQKVFKKKIYLFLWKMLGLHKKNIFHATDEEERKYIQEAFGTSAKVYMAANFPRVLPVQKVIKKEAGSLKLVSIALISPMKNILLVLEAVGSAQHTEDGQGTLGNLEYNIYGPVKDKSYWEACEVLIKKLPANIRVNYHGVIDPANIVDALAGNHVFILPSKSENFGHAIYEALAAGRPVITSNTTPWNDLQSAKAGINVSLTGTSGLVNAIAFFAAMDQEQLTEWSNGARRYAEQAADVSAIKKQYVDLFG